MKRLSLGFLALLFVFVLAGCGLFGFNSSSGENQKGSQSTEAIANDADKMTYIPMEVPKGIPVLMYHKVGPDKDNDAVIGEELFLAQMKFLKDNDFHPLTMDQLYDYVTNGAPVPTKPVVLTFDDGYADTYSIVYPTLKKYGFAATVFVNGGDVGQRLTWAQLKEMKDNGITISNHGYLHERMGEMDGERQYNNIKNGQDALARNLGIENNKWFCYPYGSTNIETAAAIKKNNIAMAVTMNPGWVHVGDDPYTLHRIWIGNAVDVDHFKERITTEHYSDL